MDRMDLVYAAADLVVARAGASSIAEVSVCGLPAILVPYPYATAGHQEANARAMQRAGGATVLPDDELSADSLTARDRGARRPARPAGGDGEALAARSPTPDAAARLADVVEDVGPMSAASEGPLPPFDAPPGSIPTLDVPDPSGWARLHLVGVGGAGMRGLAQVLLARGVAVSGSDLKDSAALDGLRAAGATIFVGHAPSRWTRRTPSSSPRRSRRGTPRFGRPARPASPC